MKLVTVPITTNASGDASATIYVSGLFAQLRYIPDGATPLDTLADLTIAGATTGVSLAAHNNIGVVAFTKAYRQPTHDLAGTAGTAVDLVAVHGEPVTLTIAAGGNTKSGTFYLWFI